MSYEAADDYLLRKVIISNLEENSREKLQVIFSNQVSNLGQSYYGHTVRPLYQGGALKT